MSHRKLTEVKAAELIAHYERDRRSLRDLSKMFGVSHETVRATLRRYNIERRPRGTQRP